ncbi:cytochrome P450 monooxygenase [Panus rudis PR-1116 ss-1]|nr:cytochrome P450 monooxygenase [Panus rudis PR-1116 ss-1]
MSNIASLLDRLLTPTSFLIAVVIAIVAIHIFPFVFNSNGLRRYPGPLFARLSNGWLAYLAYRGTINAHVYDAHKKYGTFVRIAPNQVSIAHPDALQLVYGHSSRALKSDFYDAVNHIGGTPSIFSTRSREEHARKRKLIANPLSQKGVMEFEPIIQSYQRMLIKQWDEMCAAASKDLSGIRGVRPWKASDGRAWFDCMPWYNYIAFDIIGDLAFGSGFGMVERGTDGIQVAHSSEAAMDSYGDKEANLEHEHISAVDSIVVRGEYTTATANLPKWFRPFVLIHPWYRAGHEAAMRVAKMAVTALAKRLSSQATRNDFITKLIDYRDEKGLPLERKVISAESMVLLIAGSDTTSNSTCALTYYLAKYPEYQKRLQKELDEVLGPADSSLDDSLGVCDDLFERVKHLPYLEAVVNETLRLHTTVGIGLPRVVPEEGLTIFGETFTPGTIVSVPTYTVHHDKSVWGEDADIYNPDRWFQRDKASMKKAFVPFSVGPRACVGRNLGLMELTTLTAALFHRYEFSLQRPDQPLSVRDGFLRKPLGCTVGIRRRRDINLVT